MEGREIEVNVEEFLKRIRKLATELDYTVTPTESYWDNLSNAIEIFVAINAQVDDTIMDDVRNVALATRLPVKLCLTMQEICKKRTASEKILLAVLFSFTTIVGVTFGAQDPDFWASNPITTLLKFMRLFPDVVYKQKRAVSNPIKTITYLENQIFDKDSADVLKLARNLHVMAPFVVKDLQNHEYSDLAFDLALFSKFAMPPKVAKELYDAGALQCLLEMLKDGNNKKAVDAMVGLRCFTEVYYRELIQAGTVQIALDMLQSSSAPKYGAKARAAILFLQNIQDIDKSLLNRIDIEEAVLKCLVWNPEQDEVAMRGAALGYFALKWQQNLDAAKKAFRKHPDVIYDIGLRLLALAPNIYLDANLVAVLCIGLVARGGNYDKLAKRENLELFMDSSMSIDVMQMRSNLFKIICELIVPFESKIVPTLQKRPDWLNFVHNCAPELKMPKRPDGIWIGDTLHHITGGVIYTKSQQPEQLNRCHHCEQSESHLKKCGRCQGVLYCSRECQVKDWPEHKLDCK